MTLTELMPWLVGVSTLLSILIAVTQIIGSAPKANAERIVKLNDRVDVQDSALGKRIDEHDRRIQTVENEMRHLPDKDAVHRLELSLSDMKINMTEIAASSAQAARTGQRLEDYLMEKGK